MTHPAIETHKLSKRYRIGLKEIMHETLAGATAAWLRAPIANYKRLRRLSVFDENEDGTDTIWALKDVSLEFQSGEIVGLVGRNGAGKTTLLKVLSRITEPSQGTAKIRGRIGSLLEVGTGFHPDLTGRENIYLNGTILGMRRHEIDKRFDEIVEFSGVEKFIDTPVKRYSTGMAVRLGFAVGAHLDPEILLIDEVLAVGDAGFRKKCLGKMGDVARSGRTVLFVSHNMSAISGLCDRVVWIEGGKVAGDGPAGQIVEQYMTSVRRTTHDVSLEDRSDRSGSGEVRISKMQFGVGEKPHCGNWICGREAILDIHYSCRDNEVRSNVDIAVGVRSLLDMPLLYLSTRVTGRVLDDVSGRGRVRCKIPKLPLEAGLYLLNVEVRCGNVRVDHIRSAAEVDVYDGDFYGSGTMSTYGGIACEHAWDHVGQKCLQSMSEV